VEKNPLKSVKLKKKKITLPFVVLFCLFNHSYLLFSTAKKITAKSEKTDEETKETRYSCDIFYNKAQTQNLNV